MPVRIVGEKTNDRFEIKCPFCGTTLQYSRRDVKAHVRWPNGFIYCGRCKNPIGHSEDNLIKTEKEMFEERLERKGRILTKEEKAKIGKTINLLKALRVVFLVLGIALTSAFTILIAFYPPKASDNQLDLFSLLGMLYIFFMLMGISMIIFQGAGFCTIIKTLNEELQFSDILERNEKSS